MRPRAWKRPPAVRLRVPDDTSITVRDRLQGDFTQDVARSVGDFVLKRGDGVYSYQLAVVVDDLAMRIGEVVRAIDLLDSAPRQVLLARLLGGDPPTFAHLPLVLTHDGARLAKRAHGVPIRDRRDAGQTAASLVAELARLLGLVDASASPEVTPRELLGTFDATRLRGRREVRLPAPDTA
jgi:glutamyl-tRNA synthetase